MVVTVIYLVGVLLMYLFVRKNINWKEEGLQRAEAISNVLVCLAWPIILIGGVVYYFKEGRR